MDGITGENKKEKNIDKEGRDKGGEKDGPEEQKWPPFSFDGRQALKSKLCINLKNCQYDLFRTIALEELNWRVVDYRNRVIEKHPDAPETIYKFDSSFQEDNQEDEEEIEDGEGLMKNSIDIDINSSDKIKKEGSEENQYESNQENSIKKVCPKFRVLNDFDPNNWDIFWADSGMTPDFLSSLSNKQRVNHFLGMYNICRKSTLGMHLKRFQKEFPEDFNFFPQTWIYPAEFHDI